MRWDSLVSQDKETEVSSLSPDKMTIEQAQNLAMGRVGIGFWHFAMGRAGTRWDFDILPWDGPWRNLYSLSRFIQGQDMGQKEKREKNILSLFQTILPVLERPLSVLKHPFLF